MEENSINSGKGAEFLNDLLLPNWMVTKWLDDGMGHEHASKLL